MKLSKLTIIFICSMTIICCQRNNINIGNIDNIKNTKWIYKWDKNKYDYFIFRNNNEVEYYSDEVENVDFGQYKYDSNFIILSFDSAKYMHDFSKSIMKIKINHDTLRIISSKIDGYKAKTDIDNEYVFIKVNLN